MRVAQCRSVCGASDLHPHDFLIALDELVAHFDHERESHAGLLHGDHRLVKIVGLAGEEFVINFERARLIHAGVEKLASKIEHVAKEKGDGAGFDVLSFEKSGDERLIEVKTTKYGVHTPFYISRNELEVSKSESVRYHLYRLFDFRERPQLFTLHGALSKTCTLDATNYVARVG